MGSKAIWSMGSRGKEERPDGQGTDKPTLWSNWQTQRSQARAEALGGLGDRTALRPGALGAETGAVARVCPRRGTPHVDGGVWNRWTLDENGWEWPRNWACQRIELMGKD